MVSAADGSLPGGNVTSTRMSFSVRSPEAMDSCNSTGILRMSRRYLTQGVLLFIALAIAEIDVPGGKLL